MRYLAALLLVLSFAITPRSDASEATHYVRYLGFDGPHWGIVSGGVVLELSGPPWFGGQRTGIQHSKTVVEFLPPAQPSKVLAVGWNYQSHSGDAGAAKPEVFTKLPTSLAGNGQVSVPSDASNLHFEGELVLVIGQRGRNLTEAEAHDVIFGVTVGNDLTERSWQSQDLQWFRAKASDGFAPIGPVLVEGLDWNNLTVTTRVNGEVQQQESTANLLHNPAKIVSWISRYVTLLPGDVIFTGTSGRTRPIQDGDLVEVEIDGVGVLSNRFVWAQNGS